ncbi:MAG: hypothetical protein WC373_05175 [Smithella sp.]|jgi:hypothetical protein
MSENENAIQMKPPPEESAPAKIKIIVKELKFKLTQSELDAKINELVKINNFEIPVLEETKKLAMKKYNNEIETLQSQAFKLGSIYNDKVESRNCDCVWRYNRQSKKMDLCRLAFKDPESQEIFGERLAHMRESLETDYQDFPWESNSWYPDIVIETRDLTQEERQLEMNLKEKKAEVKPPEAKPEPEILTDAETAPVKKKEKRSK